MSRERYRDRGDFMVGGGGFRAVSRAQVTAALVAGLAIVALPEPALARGEYTTADNFYRLITGGFGKLVMIFSGLGGFATLYTTRSGKAGNRTPIIGVVMILLSIVLFTMNVLITSGVIGFEHKGYEEFQRY